MNLSNLPSEQQIKEEYEKSINNKRNRIKLNISWYSDELIERLYAIIYQGETVYKEETICKKEGKQL